MGYSTKERGRMGKPATPMKITAMRRKKGKVGKLPRSLKEQGKTQSKDRTQGCRNREGAGESG